LLPQEWKTPFSLFSVHGPARFQFVCWLALFPHLVPPEFWLPPSQIRVVELSNHSQFLSKKQHFPSQEQLKAFSLPFISYRNAFLPPVFFLGTRGSFPFLDPPPSQLGLFLVPPPPPPPTSCGPLLRVVDAMSALLPPEPSNSFQPSRWAFLRCGSP